jgi:predicted dehydrogenase
MSGTTHVMSRGMEHWHPNPDFFFQVGAGPVLDVGPYYVTDLIHLIGPVKRVTAFTGMARAEREVTAEGPFKGTFVKVGTPTTIHGVMEFHSGPSSRSAPAGTWRATATTTSSSTAPRARCSCPIRTSLAATS